MSAHVAKNGFIHRHMRLCFLLFYWRAGFTGTETDKDSAIRDEINHATSKASHFMRAQMRQVGTSTSSTQAALSRTQLTRWCESNKHFASVMKETSQKQIKY